MTLSDIIYREIAKDMDLPIDLVEKVCRFQFKVVRDTMQEGNYKGVQLQYFGTFQVKKERLFKLSTKRGWKLTEEQQKQVEENNKKYAKNKL